VAEVEESSSAAMTHVCFEVFITSQPCKTIVLVARKMETLSGAKFEHYRPDNCRLKWFFLVKPTFSN